MLDHPWMNPSQIYQKTSKGVEEIRSRRFKLPKRPRILLILVDGKTPLDVVLGQAHALGIEDSVFLDLISEGFIAALSSLPGELDIDGGGDTDERFRSAQRFMNESIVNALGLRAIFFTLKLERCSNLTDLNGLVEAYHQALSKSGDVAQAEVLTSKVRSLLG
jgi:hypothetical protein